MRKSIPVIRAASLVPLMKWLVMQGHPVEQMLADSGIGYVWIDDPYAPVPIRAAEQFFLRAADLVGPDIGCRIVTDTSIHDLAALGAIVLGARTPREAMTRLASALPYHCSHEFISTTRTAQSTTIHEYWNMTLDPAALHLFQQFVAALMQLLIGNAVQDTPAFLRVDITPHPLHGVDHLRPWLTGEIRATKSSRLDMTIRNSVIDAPFRQVPRDRLGALQRLPWQRLQDGTLGSPARILIRAMLRDGSPAIENLAQMADMSVRSLQRRLGEEGLTFSDLVEETRRDIALEALGRSESRIGDIAAQVGYAKHSSFSRAVRRWTGHAPVAVRADSTGDLPEKTAAPGLAQN